MKKTLMQKQLIRENKMIPLFWCVVTDSENYMLVANVLTGEYRVLER